MEKGQEKTLEWVSQFIQLLIVAGKPEGKCHRAALAPREHRVSAPPRNPQTRATEKRRGAHE